LIFYYDVFIIGWMIMYMIDLGLGKDNRRYLLWVRLCVGCCVFVSGIWWLCGE